MANKPEKLQAAFLQLLHKRSYLGNILWNMHPREEPNLPFKSMAVDKYWRMYYDLGFVENTDLEKLVGAIYHECYHIMDNHSSRCELGCYNPEVYNIAGDMAINGGIIAEQFKMIDGAVFPSQINQPDNEIAEYYYDKIPVNIIQCPHGGSGKEGKSERKPGNSKQVPCPTCNGKGVGAGDCGSIADGKPRPYDEGEAGNDKTSEVEGGIIRRHVAEEIKKYERANGVGSVPGSWLRIADEILSSKVSWKRELPAVIRRTIATASGYVDYTYKRPSRRQSVHKDVIFPSLVRPLINVAVVGDSSGSMSDRNMSQVVAEVEGVIKALGLKDVTYISCDYAAAEAKKVRTRNQITKALVGGGGTDMGNGIRKAETLKPLPHVCIVITDGDTPWPQEQPKFRTIIVLVAGDRQTPKWAKKLVVD